MLQDIDKVMNLLVRSLRKSNLQSTITRSKLQQEEIVKQETFVATLKLGDSGKFGNKIRWLDVSS